MVRVYVGGGGCGCMCGGWVYVGRKPLKQFLDLVTAKTLHTSQAHVHIMMMMMIKKNFL